MYGRGPLGARRFCKECTERCNRPISYENALLSFGSSINLTSREKYRCIGGIKKNHSHNLGGSWNVWGGGGGGESFPPHWIEPCPGCDCKT